MSDIDPNLEHARSLLQERRIAPIWQSAVEGLSEDDPDAETISKGARGRVLRYLAARMVLEREEANPALFTLDECRQAWQLLSGVSYRDVRNWATKHRTIPAKSEAA